MTRAELEKLYGDALRAPTSVAVQVKIALLIGQLLDSRDELRAALGFYAQGARDKSFVGWEKEWRFIEPKHDFEYEFYPNHDTAVDALKADDERWAGERNFEDLSPEELKRPTNPRGSR